MTVGVTKLIAGTSSQYFTETVNEVAADHGGGMAGYYDAPGTPPGMWLGTGLSMYGLRSGQIAKTKEVSNLYDALRHPQKGAAVSRMKDESIAAGKAVGGYDLTFTLPKSVNVLWASGDPTVRATIMKAHKEAMQESLQWFENHEAYSRSGAGGAVRQRVQGLVAVTFTHWDTRDGDPHLHDHLLISNMVQRADGSIGTLDGRALMHATVGISEQHTNLFMDKLTEYLGVTWRRRDDLESKASVYEIDGVSNELIDNFSKRKASIEQKEQELLNRTVERGVPLNPKVKQGIKRAAWKVTRKAKPKMPKPLSELMHDWQEDIRSLGTDPQVLVESCVGRSFAAVDLRHIQHSKEAMSHLGQLLDDSIRDRYQGKSISNVLHENVKSQRTRITESNIRAEAARLTRGVRLLPGQAELLNNLLTSVEIARLVPLTPQRYSLSEELRADVLLSGYNGRAVTDNSEGNVYATQELLDAEQYFIEAARESYAPAQQLSMKEIEQSVAQASAHAKHPLAADQEEAATRLLHAPDRIVGLNGPAGTGKTTTLRAMVESVTALQGEGRVLGLAPTAAAAGELKQSLGIGTETLAKIIYEAQTGHTKNRLEIAQEKYSHANSKAARQQAREEVAALTAQEAALHIPSGGYVIVDEAGMADTMNMTVLARLCHEADAKIIMVGDSLQLSSPGEGTGAFAWIIEHGKSAELTSVFRFYEPQEAQRSQLLRNGVKDKGSGEYRAVDEYYAAQRIHAIKESDVEEVLVERMVQDIVNHVDSLLIVPTNEDITRLNELISDQLQALGKVADNEQGVRIRLSDGGTTGAGDVICTRQNNRKIGVRNNDLWVVQKVTDDNCLVCKSKEDDRVVTLPEQYVQDNVVGGYAITPQRSQGKTVTRAYSYLPNGGELSRSAWYVAMTRGRESNECYVAVTDPQDMVREGAPSYEVAFWRQRNRPAMKAQGRMEWTGEGDPPNREQWYTSEELLPTNEQQARLKLTQVMDARGGPMLASAWAEQYRSQTQSVGHLQAEWHYYVNVLAERRLTEQVLPADLAQSLKQQPEFPGMVEAYGEASLINRKLADDLVRANMAVDSGSVKKALEQEITDHDSGRIGWLAGRYTTVSLGEGESQNVKNAADMVNSSYALLSTAVEKRVPAHAEHVNAPRWAYRFGSVPGQDSPRREQWNNLMTQVTAWRAEHNISDPDVPLGKVSAATDRAWQQRLKQRITLYRNTPDDPNTVTYVSPTQTSRVTSAVRKSLRAGRPAFVDLDSSAVSVPEQYVRVRTSDVAQSIAAIRNSAPQSTDNLLLRFTDASQRIEAWKCLSANERYSAQELTGNGVRSLWVQAAQQLGVEQTLSDLNADKRATARIRLEREVAQEAKGLVNSTSLSEPEVSSFTISQVEASSLGGL